MFGKRHEPRALVVLELVLRLELVLMLAVVVAGTADNAKRLRECRPSRHTVDERHRDNPSCHTQ
jgi:hypothetical protein